MIKKRSHSRWWVKERRKEIRENLSETSVMFCRINYHSLSLNYSDKKSPLFHHTSFFETQFRGSVTHKDEKSMRVYLTLQSSRRRYQNQTCRSYIELLSLQRQSVFFVFFLVSWRDAWFHSQILKSSSSTILWTIKWAQLHSLIRFSDSYWTQVFTKIGRSQSGLNEGRNKVWKSSNTPWEFSSR